MLPRNEFQTLLKVERQHCCPFTLGNGFELLNIRHEVHRSLTQPLAYQRFSSAWMAGMC
jgi:hypothetical protein